MSSENGYRSAKLAYYIGSIAHTFLRVDKMSEINRTADLPALAPPSTWCLDRIWPGAMIAFGLGLTAVWTCLLAYGFARLIGIEF